MPRAAQILDATIVEAPRQRNTREENVLINKGEMPPEWDGQTHKIAQKDLDARWTKKRGQTYYGYKNHINADQEYEFIREYTLTDAAIHDSQVFDDLIDPLVQDRAVYADSAYRSAAREALLAGAGITSRIHERAHANIPLSDASKAANREKSSVRVRVEHIFGFLHTSMNRGGFVRTIGSQRAQVIIALANLTWNLSGYVQVVAPRARPKLAAA